MEHATVCSVILFTVLMLPTAWGYRRQRATDRMRRCLRTYLARTA